MDQYAITDPAQKARFVAFATRTNALIEDASTHEHAATALRAMPTDGLKALWTLAFEADLRAMRDLIAVELDAREKTPEPGDLVHVQYLSVQPVIGTNAAHIFGTLGAVDGGREIAIEEVDGGVTFIPTNMVASVSVVR